MNNLQFIATYIYNHPGARYREVMDAFHTWRGHATGTHLSNAHRSWGCQYFTDLICASRTRKGYAGHYWRRVDPEDTNKGWVITCKGMALVQHTVKPFERYMPFAPTPGGTRL